MNYIHKILYPKMLFYIILLSAFLSCSKNSDFLLDAVIEEIEAPIEEVIESPDNSGDDIISTPVDNAINIDFNFEAGNNIPLLPSNPSRTIYIATDGKSTNSGLTLNSPKDIASAFDKNFVQAGDLFYIKAGDYKFDMNPADSRQFDLSNLPSSVNKPIYWIGYKNTPGDINASEFSTVSWDDYKSNRQNADGTHYLDSSIMPTFSGNTSLAPKYIDNQSLFYCDGGEEGFVFRNIQIQYFRRGFNLRNLSNSVFENVTQANHGWFAKIKGQGGSNTDLQGSAWLIYSNSKSSWGSNNVIKNCAAYNMAFRGFTIGNSQNTLVEYSESTSDIDNGNPQDYYFHTTGKFNLFSNVRSNRLISSDHSGHGICFNQLSDNNVMIKSKVYGTNIHFDGATNCYANDIELIGDDSYGLYKGGGINILDGAEKNLIENISSKNGSSAISFSDSGKNPYTEHAGKYNTFRNLTAINKSLAIINLSWWNERDDLSESNIFENCEFSNAPYLFVVSRSNSDFMFDNCKFNSIENLQETSYKNPGNFVLNSNTQFKNSTFSNSEIPNKDNFILENINRN